MDICKLHCCDKGCEFKDTNFYGQESEEVYAYDRERLEQDDCQCLHCYGDATGEILAEWVRRHCMSRKRIPDWSEEKCKNYNKMQFVTINLGAFDPNAYDGSVIIIADSQITSLRSSDAGGLGSGAPESITVTFDYPLASSVEFTFVNIGGFTLRDLVKCIVDKYREIYKEEEETTPEQTWKFAADCTECKFENKPGDGVFAVEVAAGECVICHEDYVINDSLRKLSCGHSFHQNCLNTWLENNETCPVCRDSTSVRNCDKCENGMVVVESYVGKIPPREIREKYQMGRPATSGKYKIGNCDLEKIFISKLNYNSETKIVSLTI